MIYALLPAAGLSTRMGRPKLALPLGDRTILERVVLTVREAGVEEVLVVVGPHAPDLAPLAEGAGANALLLTGQTPDMRATVEAGLRWLEDHFHPGEQDSFLLLPADHPTLEADTVRRLLEALRLMPERSIFLPVFEGRRGHPTLIGWRHVAAIRRFPAGQGLNAYIGQHPCETQEVPVASRLVLADVDSPEDYEALRQSWEDGRGRGPDG